MLTLIASLILLFVLHITKQKIINVYVDIIRLVQVSLVTYHAGFAMKGSNKDVLSTQLYDNHASDNHSEDK